MPDARPKLLLTNDDGIEAPGLQALFAATDGLGARRVVAPAGPCSGCGHAVTTGRPIRVISQPNGWVSVEGTPGDCVRLGLHHLATETQCVVAGINAGGNLGVDVLHSGTVAAAREGAIHGRAAIAFSQYVARGKAIDWTRAALWARRVLEMLLGQESEPGTVWNVNFPHPEGAAPEPEIVFCPIDPNPLPLSYLVEGAEAKYNGVYQQRERGAGTDVDVCFGGAITISRLGLFPREEVGLNPH